MLDDDDGIDDGALVARHLKGDPVAFDLLVRRHRDRAWAVAIRTLGDPGEAEDAVQEAFLSAFRKADSFRGDAAFTTWLHRIVVNACLDRLRRRRVRPVAAFDDSVLATFADPRDELEERETALEVGKALQQLSDDQRLAIVLVDLQGMSVEDAAKVLDVPAGTVKSRCHRGRASLAVLLGHMRPERTSGRSPAREPEPVPAPLRSDRPAPPTSPESEA